jgi:hypothetical protein
VVRIAVDSISGFVTGVKNQVKCFWIVTPYSVAVGYHVASMFTLKREAAWTSEMQFVVFTYEVN